MDVEFSVALVKKKAIGWPRLETDTHVMVLGSARPLLEAFQHATTELQKWLVADYGLTERGAQILMGQAAEYQIANVVDPSFTVVGEDPQGDAAAALMDGRARHGQRPDVPLAGQPWWWSASTDRRSSTSSARSRPASRRSCVAGGWRYVPASSIPRCQASPTQQRVDCHGRAALGSRHRRQLLSRSRDGSRGDDERCVVPACRHDPRRLLARWCACGRGDREGQAAPAARARGDRHLRVDRSQRRRGLLGGAQRAGAQPRARDCWPPRRPT